MAIRHPGITGALGGNILGFGDAVMQEPFCKECRFWGVQAFVVESGYRICVNPNLRAKPCCEAGAAFGEGSDIATLADFGCTDFEAK